jgi:protein PhnA
VCGLSVEQMNGSLVASHWRGLASTMWSEEAGVQVLAARMLNRLASEDWVRDLLDQLYLAVEI